jgi:protein-disulfide isomerase
LPPVRSPTLAILAACAFVATACGGDQAERVALEKRVRALEKTVKRLTDRVRELDREQEEIAAHSEELGATQNAIKKRQGKLEGKLERFESDVDGGGAGGEKPTADVVYSVPLHDSPSRGPKVAKVTLVATLDLTERHSKELWPVLVRLSSAYGDELRIVYKSFVIRRDGSAAARAACAAAQLGEFPEMAELLFEQHGRDADWSDERLRELAAELSFDQAKWEAAFTGAACKAAVERDQKLFEALGQSAVPAVWINGRFVSGAQPFEKLKLVVEAEIVRADEYLAKRGAKLEKYYNELVKTGAKAP